MQMISNACVCWHCFVCLAGAEQYINRPDTVDSTLPAAPATGKQVLDSARARVHSSPYSGPVTSTQTSTATATDNQSPDSFTLHPG